MLYDHLGVQKKAISRRRHQSDRLPLARLSERQGQIIALLIQFAPQGQTLPECPISTADGVKAIDVGWLDARRNEIGQDIPLLTRAPEDLRRSPFALQFRSRDRRKTRPLFRCRSRRGLDMQPRRLIRILLRS
jgi:hypothetical protein